MTPDANDDKIKIKQSLEHLEYFVKLINEGASFSDESNKIADVYSRIESDDLKSLTLSPFRRLIKEGSIHRVLSGKAKDRTLIIFSDYLLICKPSTSDKKKLMIDFKCSLLDAELNPNSSGSSKPTNPTTSGVAKLTKTMFEVINPEEVILFNCSSETEKTKWVVVLQELFKNIEISREGNPIARNPLWVAAQEQAVKAKPSTKMSLKGAVALA